jgi:chromosome segregation ATPase
MRRPRDGWPAGGRDASFLLADTAIHLKEDTMTKAEEIFAQVEQLIASGTSKAEAFKQIAAARSQSVDTIRGQYYTHSRKATGSSRPRRRETTPEDALAAARTTLERAIAAIDREVEQAEVRVEEAKAEYEALKASAADKQQAIRERLEALS